MAHPPQPTNERGEFARLLNELLPATVSLAPEQIGRLWAHYDLLVRWNRVLNLTSIRNLPEIVSRHYCESLFLGASLPSGPVSVLDVGSGAGFPGVAMAVLRPDCSFTLAESHQRKAVFLREATREYSNVRVAARRAEEIPEDFDWIVSRAVRWSDVLKLATAHARPGAALRVGLLLGAEDALEMRAKARDYRWEQPVELPWGKRRVLIIGERE